MSGLPTVEKTIKSIARRLRDLDYTLVGSANLYLQGLKTNPRDIDILTTPDGIKKIDQILAKYRTKEIYFDTSDGRNSFRSFYEINDFEVEVLGNVNNAVRPIDSLEHVVKVNDIPCLSLKDELDAYRKMGRTDKVELIE